MQEEVRQDAIRVMVGLADVCELVARAFRFPDQDLAQALADGAFFADAESCLRDAGALEADIAHACAGLRPIMGTDPDGLLARMRRGSTELFYNPGPTRPVWLYEAAFFHVAEGKAKAPILFRAPITVNVERMMTAAGVRMPDDRKEPCDSVPDELTFLSYAYGKAAEACFGGDDAAMGLWLDRARTFTSAHPGRWLPAFMEAVEKEALARPQAADYVALAQVGALAVALVVQDAAQRGVVCEGSGD